MNDMVHSGEDALIPTAQTVKPATQRRHRCGMTDIRCALGFHSLYRYARVGYGTFQVRCRRCSRLWGMNDNVCAILPWSEVSELYEGPDAMFPPSTWQLLAVTGDADASTAGISRSEMDQAS